MHHGHGPPPHRLFWGAGFGRFFNSSHQGFQADTDCWEDVLGLNVCYAKSS